MRVLRLFIAVLLATSLCLLPVSASRAMTHAAKAEMTMSASSDTGGDGDCSCCSETGKCATNNVCMLKCFNAPAVLIEGLRMTQPLSQLFDNIGRATMSPFSPRPDPPPPRF